MQSDYAGVNYGLKELSDLRLAFEKIVSNISMNFECVLPAIVQNYDRQNNLVYVQGAISHTKVTGEVVDRVLLKLPCFNPCGGGVGINFPLTEGDTGWIVASDRDTTLFMKELKKSQANTSLFHKFEFGVFIPDKIKGFQIDSSDEGALVIQTLTGDTKISIKSGVINILSSNKVDVNCTNANINATNVNLTADNTTLTTETVFNGNITVNGAITTTGDVLAGTVSLKSHVHIGNVGVNTSPPVQ